METVTRLKWPEFKAFVDARGVSIQETSVGDRYYLYATDGIVQFHCRLRKDDSEHPNTSDYEDNYQTDTNYTKPFPPSNGYNFRGRGIRHTYTAGQTEAWDWKVPETRDFNAVKLILKDHVWDDKMDLQVVDVDNILGYGAGTVLATFFYDFEVDPETCNQGLIEILYEGNLLKDLYLRWRYYSNGGTDVKLKANLFLHKRG